MIKVNGKVLLVKQFSNSESKIGNIASYAKDGINTIELLYETAVEGYNVNHDLMVLMFVKFELDTLCRPVELIFRVMPYQRMDRKCANDVFTLKMVCRYINWLQFRRVIVIDPHSDVTLKLLNNAVAIYPILQWLPIVKEKIGFDEKKDSIVFPDKGAAKKYEGCDLGKRVCYFSKKRDEETSTIESFEKSNGEISEGSKCIIIDDICSSGKTLMLCARNLKKMGASHVYIIVSHCEKIALENPIFTEEDLMEKMFTSTSNMCYYHHKIEYLPVSIEV